MKNNYFFAALVIFSIVILGCNQSVQPQQGSMMEKEVSMMAEEGFEMVNGKMMMVNEKTKVMTPMEKEAMLNDGTKVMANGKVMRKDGASFMLKEGESIWMDGTFMKAGEIMEDEDSTTMEDNSIMESDSMMESTYSGKVLAGTASKYLEFSKADYDKTLKENKKILLYFYASWCPICKAEQPEAFAAFNELNDSNLVGFRVNYKDGSDDADEKDLARQFGVAYQHTKVILKDGKQVGKYPDSWSRQTYLSILEKV